MGLDLSAELELKLGRVEGKVDALRDAIYPPEVIRPLQNSGTATTAGSLVIDLGAPHVAVEWDLRTLIVVGSDDHTPVTNVTANVYSSPGLQPTLQQLRWQINTGQTTPQVPAADRLKDQVRVGGAGDHFLVVLSGTGVTTTQSFQVAATVCERARQGY